MRFAKPSNSLSETARKALELPRVPPRERHPDEATSIVICPASAPRGYRPGDGESRHLRKEPQPIRAGAMQALQLPSRGFQT